MKKQILIFAMFTLALIFAGLKSYGQDPDYVEAADVASVDCVTATPLGDCAADGPLNPIPGQPYTYEIDVDPEVVTGNITWFVYNATAVANGGHGPDIISGGDILAAAGNAEPNDGSSQFLLSADAAVYNTTTTSETIEISWQSFAATNEILLVAYVEGEDDCSDNIEAWRIQPTFAFTLDIAGLMPDGTLPVSGNANECVSPVQSAVYDGTNLKMDYGENYVFFVVNAANFVHSWQPTFTVTSTGTTVDTDDVTWAIPENAIDPGYTNWNSATTPVPARDASGAVGKDGECIIVRVYLDHGTTENDVASAVTLGVDGIMYNVPTLNYANTNLADLDPGTTAPCTNDQTDTAVYDLTPRPNVTAVDPTPFVPKP